MVGRVSRRVRPTVRSCLYCGSSLSLELGFSSFCSASCVWEGERLRERTEETLEALRAEVEERSKHRKPRRSLFGRLRSQVELDEDAATVVAMSAAGATVRQIARYTALELPDVERFLAGRAAVPRHGQRHEPPPVAAVRPSGATTRTPTWRRCPDRLTSAALPRRP